MLTCVKFMSSKVQEMYGHSHCKSLLPIFFVHFIHELIKKGITILVMVRRIWIVAAKWMNSGVLLDCLLDSSYSIIIIIPKGKLYTCRTVDSLDYLV